MIMQGKFFLFFLFLHAAMCTRFSEYRVGSGFCGHFGYEGELGGEGVRGRAVAVESVGFRILGEGWLVRIVAITLEIDLERLYEDQKVC